MFVKIRKDKIYFESYFHPRTGITANEDFSKPLYELLEKKYNIHVIISREKIKARLSSPEEIVISFFMTASRRRALAIISNRILGE